MEESHPSTIVLWFFESRSKTKTKKKKIMFLAIRIFERFKQSLVFTKKICGGKFFVCQNFVIEKKNF